jgi:hypothetical protein
MMALFSGEFESAYLNFQVLAREMPASPVPLAGEVFALAPLGRRSEVLELCERVEAWPDSESVGSLWPALAKLARGRFAGTVPLLETLSAEEIAGCEGDTELCWFAASSLAQVGQRDPAVVWLRKAIAGGLANHAFFTRHDPYLAALQGFAPYDALMTDLDARSRALVI